MTEYPLSSLAQNRDCTYYIFGNKQVCPHYPCIHTQCHDPDWLADQEDYLQDEKFWPNLGRSFKSPDSYGNILSPREWSLCEAKFERCRRLEEKRFEIDAAVAEYRKWFTEQKRAILGKGFSKAFGEYQETTSEKVGIGTPICKGSDQ